MLVEVKQAFSFARIISAKDLARYASASFASVIDCAKPSIQTSGTMQSTLEELINRNEYWSVWSAKMMGIRPKIAKNIHV